MEKLVGLRVQFVNPVEAPFGFVQNVRNAVRPILASQIIYKVSELRFLQLVRQHHTRRRIARRDQILQLIARVMPPPARVNKGLIRKRRVERSAVPAMTCHIQKRIEPAPLLPHEKQKVFVIAGVFADQKTLRPGRCLFKLDIVSSRSTRHR